MRSTIFFAAISRTCAAVTWQLEGQNARVTLLSDEGVFGGRDADGSEILRYLALVAPTHEDVTPLEQPARNEVGPSYTFTTAATRLADAVPL